MIEILDLKKVFENKKKGTVSYKEALKGISFMCKPGEIFGLLGPNGAGKTTTLRCISTLIKPTSGTITVNGFDSLKDDRKVRSVIGFLTSDMKLDGFFTPDYMMDHPKISQSEKKYSSKNFTWKNSGIKKSTNFRLV